MTTAITPDKLADQIQQQAQEKPAPITKQELSECRQNYSEAVLYLLTGFGALEFNKQGDKAFYSHFIAQMNVQFNDRVPTAGVSVTDRCNMYINPRFFNSLDVYQRVELLEHEIEHVIFLHPLRSKDYIGEIKTTKNAAGRYKCANIVMDAFINENKPHLTKDSGVTYSRVNKELAQLGSIFRIDDKQPWEVNYEKLMQAAKDNPNPGTGDGFGDPIDDHDVWSESQESGVSEEIARAVVKDAANKAKASTGAGNVPAHLQGQIMELNKSEVPWNRLLRRLVASSLRFSFERTRSRINRRYGILQPGRRKKPKLSVMVIGDESGSMGDDQVAQIFAEIDHIAAQGVSVKYLAMDAEVSEPVEYRKGMKMQRTRGGGTLYDAPIKRAAQEKPDLILLIGDLDCADTPEKPGNIPFIWCVCAQHDGAKPPVDWGHVINVPICKAK